MLVVTPLGPTAVPYYFHGQGAGRWVGTGSELLGLAGVVERSDLVALLRGCDPGDGNFLPAWKPSRRRAGWDLTLGAPKSVSLLGASAAAGGERSGPPIGPRSKRWSVTSSGGCWPCAEPGRPEAGWSLPA